MMKSHQDIKKICAHEMEVALSILINEYDQGRQPERNIGATEATTIKVKWTMNKLMWDEMEEKDQNIWPIYIYIYIYKTWKGLCNNWRFVRTFCAIKRNNKQTWIQSSTLLSWAPTEVWLSLGVGLPKSFFHRWIILQRWLFVVTWSRSVNSTLLN